MYLIEIYKIIFTQYVKKKRTLFANSERLVYNINKGIEYWPNYVKSSRLRITYQDVGKPW